MPGEPVTPAPSRSALPRRVRERKSALSEQRPHRIDFKRLVGYDPLPPGVLVFELSKVTDIPLLHPRVFELEHVERVQAHSALAANLRLIRLATLGLLQNPERSAPRCTLISSWILSEPEDSSCNVFIIGGLTTSANHQNRGLNQVTIMTQEKIHVLVGPSRCYFRNRNPI